MSFIFSLKAQNHPCIDFLDEKSESSIFFISINSHGNIICSIGDNYNDVMVGELIDNMSLLDDKIFGFFSRFVEQYTISNDGTVLSKLEYDENLLQNGPIFVIKNENKILDNWTLEISKKIIEKYNLYNIPFEYRKICYFPNFELVEIIKFKYKKTNENYKKKR